MQQSKIYAKFLESQGFLDEALVLYKQLLQKNPNDIELKNAIKRLQKTKFKGVNKKALNFFIKMKKPKFNEFERWLIKGF